VNRRSLPLASIAVPLGAGAQSVKRRIVPSSLLARADEVIE
jgi:hypothetical protein